MKANSMNPLKPIRQLLRKTQAELAVALDISRGLWSVHEGKPAGHLVPPHIARSLIAFAKLQGVPLTYEHLYEGAELPRMVMVEVNKLPPELKPIAKPKEKRTRRVTYQA